MRVRRCPERPNLTQPMIQPFPTVPGYGRRVRPVRDRATGQYPHLAPAPNYT